MISTQQVLQFLITGITNGSIYALIALGFVVIYSVTSVINFAQGEFAMLGALMAVSLIAAGLPQGLALVRGPTLVLQPLLHLFFTRTMLGRSLRACAVNRLAARLMGIRTDRMALLAFGLSGAVGGPGGSHHCALLFAPLRHGPDAQPQGVGG